jgi:hypothetical protein
MGLRRRWVTRIADPMSSECTAIATANSAMTRCASEVRSSWVGIISMNDLVMKAECRKGADLPGEEFLEALQSICTHSTEAVRA